MASSTIEPSSPLQLPTEGHRFIENGHIVYPEERLRIENHRSINNAIMHFRDWREKYESTSSTLSVSDIPQEYMRLIAMLAHDSDETLSMLANRLNDLLSPFNKNAKASTAFYKAIRQIIKATAHQERYGLADIVLLLKGSPPSIPKRLSLFRWQANDTTGFPSQVKQVASDRRQNRKSFSRAFTIAFQKLSANERIQLLFDEQGHFVVEPTSKPTTQIDTIPHHNSLFASFQQPQHVSLVRQPRKRLCSSFDTLFYVGLNNSFDLRQRFLNELDANTKRPRGLTRPAIDMRKAWVDSTTGRRGFYQSPVYKQIRNLKMKLLQFHEDVRPAYYGTWSKPDQHIVTGRRPFAKDTSVLDYDYDSEAEWDYDVDGDDIYTLDPDEDEDMLLPEDLSAHEEEVPNDDDEEIRWVVPEGYLSEDEGIHRPLHRRVVSRPAKWPITGNKHFPMKPVIIGPSFESEQEPENHPLSDFKVHLLVDVPSDGYSPFHQPNGVKVTPSTVCIAEKAKPPLFQREIDKIVQSNRKELVNIILENKTKTMMGLVGVLKSNKSFHEYTTAQLQAMIHDLAIQEVRDSKEYNWYLRGLTHKTP